jgi:predicted Rossmann fold nucleotide-binding protein DprA/Smf involved in DNA uptake
MDASATDRSIDSSVMQALEDNSLWSGPRPQTGSGDVAVRVDELATALKLPIGKVHDSLERLESVGRVCNIGGHMADPTPRWHTLRRR